MLKINQRKRDTMIKNPILMLMWKLVEENDHLYYTFAKPPQGMSLLEDIPYMEDDLAAHRLDLARPLGYEGKLPVIVHVHGGGWVSGDKHSYYQYYGMELSTHGFAVLTVNYRLAFDNPFPAQIEDLSAVLKWIANNADAYDLDASHVYLVGDSAGAHLCALLANTLMDVELCAKLGIEKSNVKIRALGLSCGVYDLERLLDSKVDFPNLKLTVETLFGQEDYVNHPLFTYSSVSAHLQDEFPPTYLLTSVCDNLNVETLAFADELSDKGIDHELRIMDEELKLGHVFNIKLNIPESLEVMSDMIRFFKRVK
jgi:acetyl esterase/lipase